MCAIAKQACYYVPLTCELPHGMTVQVHDYVSL